MHLSDDNIQLAVTSKKLQTNYFNRFVIKIDSTWKAFFDNVMLIVSTYNTFTQAYIAAFESDEELYTKLSDYFIEFLFALDFVFCFCEEYKDEELYSIVTDIKKIAVHYIKGSCIFDFLAIVPFKDIFYSHITNRSKLRLFSLFKLLRVPRLFGLLNVERFKQSITAYYNNKLEEKVRRNIETENYPILKQLMYV